MIRSAVVDAVLAARLGRERKGYLHHVHTMATSPKWSLL